jgi:hypothetical protein
VHLARQGWARSAAAPDTARALRLASALFDTAFEALDVYRLAEHMTNDTVGEAFRTLDNPCAGKAGQTTVVVNPATGSVTVSVVEGLATQLEVSSRTFLDADVASVLGFVPGINGGLDYVLLRNGGTVERTVLPVFGAGVRREAL